MYSCKRIEYIECLIEITDGLKRIIKIMTKEIDKAKSNGDDKKHKANFDDYVKSKKVFEDWLKRDNYKLNKYRYKRPGKRLLDYKEKNYLKFDFEDYIK